MQTAKSSVRCYRFEGGRSQVTETQAITETAVALTVNGEDWLAFMCSPLDLEALAVGFLYDEGLIQTKDEIASVRLCPTGDNVDVWLTHNIEQPAHWRRTSGCTGGMTSVPVSVTGERAGQGWADPEPAGQERAGHGPAGQERAGQGPAPTEGVGLKLSPEQVTALIGKLFASQDLYQSAGGVHTSALSDGTRILVVAEDIGRHNTLDKIAGRCLLDGIDPSQRVIITTGRVSSEMMQKAARMGVAMVISRTAPTSLSIEIAMLSGITLIGYARRDRFTVYCHPERVVDINTEDLSKE